MDFYNKLGKSGDKSEFRECFRSLGYPIAMINYRLSLEENQVVYPDHTQDVAEALAFLFQQKWVPFCQKWERMYVMGHSCGAQLLGSVILNSFWLKEKVKFIHGFIGIEGIYDVPYMVETFASYADWFVKRALTSDVRLWNIQLSCFLIHVVRMRKQLS